MQLRSEIGNKKPGAAQRPRQRLRSTPRLLRAPPAREAAALGPAAAAPHFCGARRGGSAVGARPARSRSAPLPPPALIHGHGDAAAPPPPRAGP